MKNLTERIPLKQGLKLEKMPLELAAMILTERIPLKQGLKLGNMQAAGTNITLSQSEFH